MHMVGPAVDEDAALLEHNSGNPMPTEPQPPATSLRLTKPCSPRRLSPISPRCVSPSLGTSRDNATIAVDDVTYKPPNALKPAVRSAQHPAATGTAANEEREKLHAAGDVAESVPDTAPNWQIQKFAARLIECFYEERESEGGEKISTAAPGTQRGNGEGSSSRKASSSAQSGKHQSTTQGHDGRVRNPAKGNKSRGARAGPSTAASAAAKVSDPDLFACPFWKKDALQHRHCSRGLQRIRDVKQHLRRSHARPAQCERCGEDFISADDLSAHRREAEGCELREFEPAEGLTEEQRQKLRKYSDRTFESAEQWFAIWDVVFPGVARPTSPYVNWKLSEELEGFREFVPRRGAEILMSMSNTIQGVSFNLVQDCVQQACDAYIITRQVGATHVSRLPTIAETAAQMPSLDGMELAPATMTPMSMDGSLSPPGTLPGIPLDPLDEYATAFAAAQGDFPGYDMPFQEAVTTDLVMDGQPSVPGQFFMQQYLQ
ncbi:hypothetical protein NKR23_g9063 [Pleurostoma richardsiae]|uniref:C2H2-type domain-containing protein n=1 Tax=Pleurostoma richardsiae TaxID=41990 RepID=A0AA38RGQ1_9PEZI|nr:hypothetical protein NKR23_g9063 [Pleurostoma richardsiae]